VFRRAGLSFVFTVDADQRARLRPVVAGAVDGAVTEIRAGLTEGDRVVNNPPSNLTDGSRVATSADSRQTTSAPQETRQ
jgi:multidrug efflux system membrane fusion protein